MKLLRNQGMGLSYPPNKYITPNRVSFLLLVAAFFMMYLDPLVLFTEKNIHVSDLFIILSWICCIFVPTDGARLLWNIRKGPVTLPFVVFTSGAIFSIVTRYLSDSIVLEKSMLALLQLVFVFFVLAPLIFLHSQSFSRLVILWRIHWIMIAFAGVLSLSDHLGYTTLTEQSYYRHVNPFLGVNGFWVFGLVSPFLIHYALHCFSLMRISSCIAYTTLWCLGFVGIMLAGVRTGLYLTIMSIIWVIWFYRPWNSFRSRPKRFSNGLITLFLVILVFGGSFVFKETDTVFKVRSEAEAGSSENTLALRLDLVNMAFEEPSWPSLLLGIGLNQFVELHSTANDTIHNHYLQALYETGLLGLIGLSGVYFGIFRQVRKRYRNALLMGGKEEALFWNSSLFVVVGVVAAGMIYPIGFSRFDWVFFLLAAGPVALLPRKMMGKIGSNNGIPSAAH